jgi:hypothetical protein
MPSHFLLTAIPVFPLSRTLYPSQGCPPSNPSFPCPLSLLLSESRKASIRRTWTRKRLRRTITSFLVSSLSMFPRSSRLSRQEESSSRGRSSYPSSSSSSSSLVRLSLLLPHTKCPGKQESDLPSPLDPNTTTSPAVGSNFAASVHTLL